MAKSDKFEQKQHQLTERTQRALGLANGSDAAALLRTARKQSIRFNTLIAPRSVSEAQLTTSGWQGSDYAWFQDGATIDADSSTIARHDLAESGAIYIQNAASWLPVLALDPQPGESILDMCAAPGGKTSHIAQHSNNQASITANDNSRPRLLRMQRNLTRLGVKNVTYTLFDATRLSQKIDTQQFDKILLDAPCSGEGMLAIDSRKEMATWSVAHIKRLQSLQKRLVSEAWRLLKPGGTLVYSTCTMAPDENEAVVDYLLRRHSNASIEPIAAGDQLPNRSPAVLEWNDKSYHPSIAHSLRLHPSTTIEAFYVARLYKQPDVL